MTFYVDETVSYKITSYPPGRAHEADFWRGYPVDDEFEDEIESYEVAEWDEDGDEEIRRPLDYYFPRN